MSIKKKSMIYFLFLLFSLSAKLENSKPFAYVITINNDIINPITSKFISKSIDEACKIKASCLVIELDTPGGLLESTREIVKNILNSPVPVVVYVTPKGSRAASAGMFITCSAHIAAMAPSTHIGAAHPVAIGMPMSPSRQPDMDLPSSKKEKLAQPKQADNDVMLEKILQDTLAWVTSIANARKRNVEWMKDSVSKSISATEEEALKLKVIDYTAKDIHELLEKIDGITLEVQGRQIKLATKNAEVRYFEMTLPEKFLNILANPNIAYIFMTLGMIGLVFEFTHPGVLFPGIAGLICLLMAFYSFNTLPVNYTGMLMIIFSIILFIAELFAPAFGALAIGGVISFIFGSMMLIQSGYPFLQISLGLILFVGFILLFVILFITYVILFGRFKKPSTGKEGMIGTIVKTKTELNPEGKVYIHGEIWSAVEADNNYIEANRNVKIIEINGLILKVKQI